MYIDFDFLSAEGINFDFSVKYKVKQKERTQLYCKLSHYA